MDKLKMETTDISQENIEKIGKLFPSAVSEVVGEDGKVKLAIDFDVLKQELSSSIINDKQERYQMTWPDKKKSILLANSKVNATLRPDREKSVDFDNTQNLYIEGDNLDVLKILRENCLGAVKVIYIDPPYNTGNDFIYEDNFSTDSKEFLKRSGQYDEQGNRLEKNLDSNGRYHTNWLNMMYPRLKVARDLLSKEGAIFISIDHNELLNLSKICDEIFGANNRLGIITVVNNMKGRSDDNYFATCNEFLLVYCKDRQKFEVTGFELSEEELESDYDKQDEISFYKLIGFRKTGSGWERSARPFMFYPVLYKNGEFSTIEDDEFKGIFDSKTSEFNDDYVAELTTKYENLGYRVTWPKTENGEWGRWRWGRDTFLSEKDNNLEYNNSGTLCTKMRATLEDGSVRVKTAKTLWYKSEYDTGSASKVVKSLFNTSSDIFNNPKSVIYLQDIFKISTQKDSLILDFFSGSGTTAHSIMRLNAEDNGQRRYILVQLPEKCDESSEAYKNGYSNICDLAQERIRRAGQKIKTDYTNSSFDYGFRVLKLDSSNMQDVYYNPKTMQQSLLDATVDNIKEDRTSEDLLFQVMISLGIDLSSQIAVNNIAGKTYYTVNENDIIACFDDNLTNEVITEIAKLQPVYAVFKDKSFATDSVGINNEQLFKTYSPNTTIKVL